MKILIVNIDSKIPNIALEKIKMYHESCGDEIKYDLPIYKDWSDRIYVSCIFTWNRSKCLEWESEKTLIGGSGWDISVNLPDHIDRFNPAINYGFTTRGCIRKCPWCIVPEKEGKVEIKGDIYDFWDRNSEKIFILDNNIMAIPFHFERICGQIKKERLNVDFNQGLDHRFIDKDNWKILLSLKCKHIRFSFDSISLKKSAIKSLDIMKSINLPVSKTIWYIYCSDLESFDSTIERLNIIRQYKQDVYLMRDRSIIRNPKYIALAKYCNSRGTFRGGSFQDSLIHSKEMKRYRKYFREEK